MAERIAGFPRGEIFDFDPPISSEQDSEKLSLSKMGEGFVAVLAIIGTAALALQMADQERYFQILRSHVEVPQTALALCLVAGLANALRARYTNRLLRS